jgi:hypothetical protein
MNRVHDMNNKNEAICVQSGDKVESMVTTDRDRLPEARQIHRVRFHPTKCTAFMIPNESFQSIEECKHLLWYQHDDIQKFQRNDEMLIKKYRTLVRNIQRLGRTKLNNIEINEMEAEMRGLEDDFTVLSHLRHQRRLEDSFYAVMIEQERQRDLWSKNSKDSHSFLLDVEMVQKVYSSSAMSSKLIAYSLGRADATFARQFQKISPTYKYTLLKDGRVGTKNMETRSSSQRNRAPLQTKEENAITTITASSILRQRHLGHINGHINAFHVTGATRVSI